MKRLLRRWCVPGKRYRKNEVRFRGWTTFRNGRGGASLYGHDYRKCDNYDGLEIKVRGIRPTSWIGLVCPEHWPTESPATNLLATRAVDVICGVIIAPLVRKRERTSLPEFSWLAPTDQPSELLHFLIATNSKR